MDLKPKVEPDCVETETDRLARELQRALADNKRLRQDNKFLRLSQNLGRSAVKNEPEELINVDDDDVLMHSLPLPAGSEVEVEIIEILDDDDASCVVAKTEPIPHSISRPGVALKREQGIPPSSSGVKKEIMETSDAAGQAPAAETPKIRVPSSIPSHAPRPTPKIVNPEPSLPPIQPSAEVHSVKEEDIGISVGDDARTFLLPIPLTCDATPSPSAPPVYSNRGVSKRERSPSPTPSPVENDARSPHGRPASANPCQSAASDNQSTGVAPKPSKRQKVAPGKKKQPGEALAASYLAGLVPLVINPPLTLTLSLPSRADMKHWFGCSHRSLRPMRFTKAPLADRAVQFFDYDSDPGMPTKPGDPGVSFSLFPRPMGDWARAVFVSRIEQRHAQSWSTWFASQSPQFQRAWADRIVTQRKYRNFIKARTALRTAGQGITLPSVVAEREEPLAAATVDDVIQAFTYDKEISVVRMTCVSYDHKGLLDCTNLAAPIFVADPKIEEGRAQIWRTELHAPIDCIMGAVQSIAAVWLYPERMAGIAGTTEIAQILSRVPLPQELIDAIVDEIDSSSTDFQSTCLVASIFVAPCQRRLFQTIEVFTYWHHL
ncbi:hypothetical protein C8R43DRAFT_1119152 [Mycena crocata]|nr:hypothetical protein C8R43DRAFT_1119152 [Mycena crocata]